MVTPRGGAPWIGSFEAGIGGLTGAFGTPNPRTLLVIQAGRGYLVPVDRPHEYRRVPVNPVLEIHPFPDEQRLVLASHTRLAGIGPSGIEWTTQDLSADGFEEIRPLSGALYVMALMPSGDRVEHVVAARDGSLYDQGKSTPK
jgi:hypothetical protein